MTDRELLELAAKAAGYEVRSDGEGGLTIPTRRGASREWNPLTDDGDALRLAIALNLNVEINNFRVMVGSDLDVDGCYLVFSGMQSKPSVVRKAITMVAAQIGAQM